MKTEKKIITRNNHTYKIVEGERSYIEYYIDLPAGVKKRKRVYGWMAKEKNPQSRYAKALELIGQIEKERTFTKPMNRGHAYELPKSPLSEVLKKNRKLYRPKSYHTIKSRLKAYILFLNGKSELDVTTEDVNDFLKYYLEKGLHVSTVSSYQTTISTLYNQLGDFNPFKRSIKIKKSYTSYKFFNNEQIRRLKEYLQKNHPDIWMVCQLEYYCFIRPGEQRLLLCSDINPEEKFIEVRAEISKNKKTQKVRIPDIFLPRLKKYLKSRNGAALLFSKDKKGKIPVYQDYFNKTHKSVLNHLQITGRYALYSWKHTGVVKAVKAGINIKDLQLQLRHYSLDMVNEYLKNLGVMDSEDLRVKFPEI